MSQIDFQMQPQLQDNWCWAAVAASVSAHWPVPQVFLQCAIANAELAEEACCGGGSLENCDKPAKLSTGLDIVQHLNTFSLGAISYESLCAEIDQLRPVCLRISTNGIGHFVAVTGYLDGDVNRRVVVDDPAKGRGRSDVPYADLLHDYFGSGVWTHTYFLREK